MTHTPGPWRVDNGAKYMLEALLRISTLSTERDAEKALRSIQMICRAIIIRVRGGAAQCGR